MRGKELAADRLLTASAIAFFLSYIIFYLYPVEGPRYHLAAQFAREMDGYLFVPFAHKIMDSAAVHGGAMPSSHTAVALIVLLYVCRESRAWGYVLIPVITGLMVGCVWGRFHYISDVLAGMAIAAVALWLSRLIFEKGLLGSQNLSHTP